MIKLQSLKLDVAENKIKIAAIIDHTEAIPITYTSLTSPNDGFPVTFVRQLDSTVDETTVTYQPEKPYYFNIMYDSSVVTPGLDAETHTIMLSSKSITLNALQEYLNELYNEVIKIETDLDMHSSLSAVDERYYALQEGETITYQLGGVNGRLLDVYGQYYTYEVGNAELKDKFADCYFTGIYIDTQDSFICTNEPSAIAKNDGIDIPLSDHCKAINPDTNGNIDLNSFIRTFDTKNDMFFVFLEADAGSTDVSGWTDDEKQSTVVGIIFSKTELQKTVFNQIKNVACQDRCNTTCNDVLPILWYKAFQLSGSGDLVKDSIKYWKLIHNTDTTTTNNCSCNG